MKQLGLKTYDDIVNYLSFIEGKYRETEEELSNIKIGLFTADKTKLKARKAKLEEDLEKYTDIYDYYDILFREATTFERRDFSLFIARYFSVVFGKSYEVQCGVRDVTESKYAKMCDFVASTEDLEKLEKKYDLNGNVKMGEIIAECEDTCLYLGGTSRHRIFEDSELNSDFAEFPEILEAGRRLIDLKLSDPELSDQKRLMMVLRSFIDEEKQKSQGEQHVQSSPKGRTLTDDEIQASMEQALKNIRAFVNNTLESEQQAQPVQAIPTEPLVFGEEKMEEQVVPPIPQPASEKKLTKSLMGRYMGR